MSEPVIKLLKYQELLSQVVGTVFCVSINQKGLMTDCVYRRKKMGTDAFDVCTWVEGQVKKILTHAREVGKKVTGSVNV